MYKAGYDPTSFVDFFEKIQSDEKKKKGSIAKIFASHPPTGDRIKNSQKDIQEILKAKPEYVVSTSEFDEIKKRLQVAQNKRKGEDKDPNRPTLKRAPGSQVPIEDERPTLKRKSTVLSD
jgi:beta-barrel assembly-enhancing protease